MRQRLALACALLGDPGLLILDEPTVGLDPEQRARFRELIAHQGSQRSVILSTHQTDDVVAICHRVLVLDAGRLIFDGPPQSLTDLARGRVWLAADPSTGEVFSQWPIGDGAHRVLGTPPDGVELVEPTIDDGYLLLSAECSSPEGRGV